MATLIKTIDDLKKYVSVNKNLDLASVEPYIKQAERKYIVPLVGDTMYESYTGTAPADAIPVKVYELLREASSNLCWFLYLPLANVQVSDSGIAVSSGENHKAAEWWQVRDLRRSFIDAGFTALDEALKIMEANETAFSDWVGSDGYTVSKELFVKRTDTFNRWFNINNSRKTFIALRPYMLEVHHQYFTAKLNAETIALLIHATKPENTIALELASGTTHYRTLDMLQAAQVNYTVAKAIQSGTFELTSNGIYEKIEEFPGYKAQPLGEKQLRRIHDERLTAGEEYYKKALKIIEANPSEFPDYETKATAAFVRPKNTGSIVGF
tara:strand:+ start:15036 stop:16010 length:975 start_codon:yes stop_codon:yes gene_type:complete